MIIFKIITLIYVALAIIATIGALTFEKKVSISEDKELIIAAIIGLVVLMFLIYDFFIK